MKIIFNLKAKFIKVYICCCLISISISTHASAYKRVNPLNYVIIPVYIHISDYLCETV